MGKCSVCGKKIEYNRYKKIDGKIYCLDCVPKKIAETLIKTVEDSKVKFEKFTEALGEVNEIVAKEKSATPEEIEKVAEEEAKEQFEKTMTGYGTELAMEARKKTKADEAIKVDSKVMDRLKEVESYQYKPKKKRGKKKA